METLPKTSGVYAIVNHVNGKRYVGSTVNFQRRWYVHRSYLRQGRHHAFKLQRAWAKYGEASFEVVILEHLPEDCMRLLEREQYWIDTLHPEYNSALIAENTSADPAVRARISQALKGKVFSPERSRRISEALTGKKLSAAHRKRISEVQIGHKVSDETRERHRQSMLGNPKARYPKPDSQKEKARANMKRLWADPSYSEGRREMLDAARRAKSMPAPSEETRKKRGVSRKKTWEQQKQQGFVHPRDEKGRLLPKSAWPAYFATHHPESAAS